MLITIWFKSKFNKHVKTSNFPKNIENHEFLNKKISLLRPSKEVENNVFALNVEMGMTKPEIKNYLEKVYNFDNIKKVNTLITMGKIKRDNKGCNIISKKKRTR